MGLGHIKTNCPRKIKVISATETLTLSFSFAARSPLKKRKLVKFLNENSSGEKQLSQKIL